MTKNFQKKWPDSLAESFYTVMLVATTGNLKRKNLFGWIGRFLSAIWLIVGIVLLAYLTSSITSVMTTLSLSGDINGLDDLNNKKIAVLSGSVSETFVKNNGYSYKSYANIKDAVAGLKKGEAPAIIGDSPVLEYYSFKDPKTPVKVVGKIFRPDKYGFGLSRNDTLEKIITIEILKAHESGLLGDLKLKYFGLKH